jgi:4-hydroxybenzoate polyprenyltransferase
MDQWVYNEGIQSHSTSLCGIVALTYYHLGFLHAMDQLGYVAIASVILCLFLVVSWIVLPRSRTNRHYLSLGLSSSLGMIAVR